jgi:hypothetical protein
MNEIIHSAPLATMAESSHGASSPFVKKLEYLFSSSRNIYLFCCIVAFQLTYRLSLVHLNHLHVHLGFFKMDQDKSSKLMASLHEMHLKGTKNL